MLVFQECRFRAIFVSVDHATLELPICISSCFEMEGQL